jgi:DNA-binding response OmpR family regulator
MTPANGHRKIVIVDDDPLLSGVIVPYLVHSGYEPILAKDGAEGMEMVVLHSPALVILDVSRPELSGIETLLELKQHDATRNIPVFVSSTDNVLSVRHAVERAGAKLFFTKPCAPAKLLQYVKAVLG